MNAPMAMPIRPYSTVKITWTPHITGILRLPDNTGTVEAKHMAKSAH